MAVLAIGYGMLGLVGCKAPGGGQFATESKPEAQVGPGSTREVLALSHDGGYGLTELGPGLLELAGRTVLQEALLDAGLQQRAARAGVRVTPEMMDRERELLVQLAGADPNMLDNLRRERGFGPTRLEAFVRRNALLRALVGEPERMPDDAVRNAFDLQYGARRVVRVLVARNATEAGAIRERLVGLPIEQLQWAFAAEAFAASQDPSAAAGGYLGAVHPLDPRLPAVIRETLAATPDGSLSPVVLAPNGAALILPIQTTEAADVTLSEVEEDLRVELRVRSQRLLMDDLAAEILRLSDPTVLDRSLEWSWTGGVR